MTSTGAAFTEELTSLWATGPVRQIAALGGGSINGAYRVRGRNGTCHRRVHRSPDRIQVKREHAAIAIALAAGLPQAVLEDGTRFYATVQERNVWTYETVSLEGNPGPRRFIRPPPYVLFMTRCRTLMA